MNMLSIRAKQILYGSLILGLFTLMIPYGERLKEVKAEKDLGEATVGRVDAGSFMLNLAMIGGARGVVANALWMRAQELQKLQEWDRLKSTVDFITKLQPHFLSIWTFQGWNLAYNVSVEWDDPADKYVWVKEGIEFVKKGTDRNPKSPDLHWDAAWFYYHKLGFSDEAIILRRLFHDDDDDAFKTDPIENRPYDDNFQVAKGWFELAIDKADQYQRTIATDMEAGVEYVDPRTNRKGRPGDLAFRGMPAHAQTKYAEALEKRSMVGIDATFGEKARNEWRKALNEWSEFGQHPFPSHNAIMVDGALRDQWIRVGDSLRIPELRETAIDPEYWQRELGIENVTLEEARRLAENQIYWTDRWANQMNFPFWYQRCQAEMQPDGVEARRLFYEGTIAYLNARFISETDPETGEEIPGAADLFREGLEKWAKVLEDYPRYREDDLNLKDTGLIVYRYAQALQQSGLEMPEDTPFRDILEEAEFDPQLDPFDALDMLGPESEAVAGN